MFLRKSLVRAACLLALSSPAWASPAQTYDFGQPALAAMATRRVEVVMGDMSFTPKADMDHGSIPGTEHSSHGHGMKHDDPNSVLVEPGKTAELTWTFTKATNLEFACNIPGHHQAGMVGKLTVSQ